MKTITAAVAALMLAGSAAAHAGPVLAASTAHGQEQAGPLNEDAPVRQSIYDFATGRAPRGPIVGDGPRRRLGPINDEAAIRQSIYDFSAGKPANVRTLR